MSVKVNFKKSYYRWLFGGMGFHNSEVSMTPMMSDKFLNERVIKAYREISPTFSRLFAGFGDWTEEAMEHFAAYYHKTFAQNDCSIYMVPRRLPHRIYESDEEMAEWAENVARKLHHVIRDKNCPLIRYYCLTNELATDITWAKYGDDLDRFKRHSKMLFDAFHKYELENVGLVSTDSSGTGNFKHIDWAIKNMDSITDIYCTHHYGNDGRKTNTEFYYYFRDLISDMVQKCKGRQKRFILGEFGMHTTWGQSSIMMPDVPDGFLDPAEEAKTAFTCCVKALASMNAGAYATVYWTMVDYPDPYIIDDGHTPEAKARHEVGRFTGWNTAIRYNKNGMIHWTNDGDYNANAYMYSMGLMARYFRKNSCVLEFDSSDESVICGGTVNLDGSYSYCIMNCAGEAREIDFSTEYTTDKPFRMFTYDSANVPYNDFGDFQDFENVKPNENGDVHIMLPPSSMVILTTDYKNRTPSAVSVTSVSEDRITWAASRDAEHCYYRVFEDGKQIGSTVAEYLERCTKPNAIYTVKSVDKFGNI